MCWANLLARMLDEVDSRKLDLARNFNLPRPRPGLAEVGKVASCCADELIDVYRSWHIANLSLNMHLEWSIRDAGTRPSWLRSGMACVVMVNSNQEDIWHAHQ